MEDMDQHGVRSVECDVKWVEGRWGLNTKHHFAERAARGRWKNFFPFNSPMFRQFVKLDKLQILHIYLT